MVFVLGRGAAGGQCRPRQRRCRVGIWFGGGTFSQTAQHEHTSLGRPAAQLRSPLGSFVTVQGRTPAALAFEQAHELFDAEKENWQQDARAVRDTCERIGLSVVMERSRSGNGAHVWMFFEEPIPARLARNLGSHVLTETMESRPDLGLRSYDRLFPNQDTLPKGGFGNLIALPLQHEPRQRGNSVFLNAEFEPYQDQWAYLSSVPKLGYSLIERIVRDAERKGTVIGVSVVEPDEDDDQTPWTAPPSRRRGVALVAGSLPENMELVLDDQIYMAKEGLPPAIAESPHSFGRLSKS